MQLTKVMVIDEAMLRHKDACEDGFKWFMRNIKELPIKNLKAIEGDYKAYIKWLKRRFLGVDYYRDEKGRVVKEIREDEEIAFTYNSDGDLIKATSVKLPSTELFWSREYSNGKIISELYYPNSKTTYKYDEEGRLTERKRDNWKKVISYPDKYTKKVEALWYWLETPES